MSDMGVHNPEQFHDYTGGPQEAHDVHNRWKREEALPNPQGQLFNPESTPRQEAHHQTPEQFAKDPRTWWHGRYTAAKSRLGGGRGKEGFHAGTEGAARTRLKANAGRRSPKPGIEGHLFPLRITGPVEGPGNVHPDVPVHTDLGPRRPGSWGGESTGGRRTGYLYQNAVESPGSISVGVPERKGFLSTHREMVQGAQKSGQYVHPNIEWATKAATEHTGETYPEPHQWRYGSTPKQLDLSHIQTTSASQFHMPEKQTVQRTSYTTEGGRRKHVFRFTGGFGTALNPRQWEPSG